MSTTIEQLAEIARRCKEGQPLTNDLSAWLAKGLESFLARHVGSLDEALGMRAMRGGMPWWREAANRQRDDALRALAERHFPQLSLTAKAERVARQSARYASTTWRFDREKNEMPEAYRGNPVEHLWTAFKTGAPMPIGERQLRTILKGGDKPKVSLRPMMIEIASGANALLLAVMLTACTPMLTSGMSPTAHDCRPFGAQPGCGGRRQDQLSEARQHESPFLFPTAMLRSPLDGTEHV